jgi:hypothetical protein
MACAAAEHTLPASVDVPGQQGGPFDVLLRAACVCAGRCTWHMA